MARHVHHADVRALLRIRRVGGHHEYSMVACAVHRLGGPGQLAVRVRGSRRVFEEGPGWHRRADRAHSWRSGACRRRVLSVSSGQPTAHLQRVDACGHGHLLGDGAYRRDARVHRCVRRPSAPRARAAGTRGGRYRRGVRRGAQLCHGLFVPYGRTPELGHRASAYRLWHHIHGNGRGGLASRPWGSTH